MGYAPASTNPLVPADATTACFALSSSLPATLNDHELRPSVRAVPADCHSPVASLQGRFSPGLRQHLRPGAFHSCRPLFHSVQAYGCNRSPAQPLAHDHFVNSPVNALHLSRLSSSAFLVGIDPNEIGLTHAQISFAPGAKAYD